MATAKRLATRVCARTLWCAGVAIHQVGSLVHGLGRATLRLAHRMDTTLNKFW